MSEPIQVGRVTYAPGYLTVSSGSFNLANLKADQLSMSLSPIPVVELKIAVDGKLYTGDEVKANRAGA